MTQHSQNGEGVEVLLPCPNPWCYSHERDFPLTRLGITEVPMVHGRIGFRVKCSDCGLHGPTVERKANTYAAWNTRQSLAREPATADVAALRKALANTTAIVRLQNGNLHDDINQILAQADDALSRAAPSSEPAIAEGERGIGWVAWNPDSGEEYTRDHPVTSGECVEAERIRPSTPQEDVLWDAFQEQFIRAEALVAALATTPPTTNDAIPAGEVERLRHKLWMVACHATGGGIPEIGGIDRSTNDICVQITAHTNRLRERVINTPETADFMAGVPIEAAHQRGRWATDHDAGKSPFDWFWLIGYLSQKAADAAVRGDAEKAKHHTISTAAALANWHAHLTGADTSMRPGIEPPAALSAAPSAPATEAGEEA